MLRYWLIKITPFHVIFVPANLASPYLQSTADVIQIRQDVGDAAKSMISAAEAAGIKLYVTAGYRSYDEQQTLL